MFGENKTDIDSSSKPHAKLHKRHNACLSIVCMLLPSSAALCMKINDNLLDKKFIRDDNMSNLNNEHYWGCKCWLALMAFALATWIVMGSEWSGELVGAELK